MHASVDVFTSLSCVHARSTHGTVLVSTEISIKLVVCLSAYGACSFNRVDFGIPVIFTYYSGLVCIACFQVCVTQLAHHLNTPMRP